MLIRRADVITKTRNDNATELTTYQLSGEVAVEACAGNGLLSLYFNGPTEDLHIDRVVSFQLYEPEEME